MQFTQEHGLERQKLSEKRTHHLMEQYTLLKEGLAGDHPRMAAAKSNYYRAAATLARHDANHRPSFAEAEQQRARLVAMRMSSRE